VRQAYVEANDSTTPSIQKIRERIEEAIQATPGSAAVRLSTWLQMPEQQHKPKLLTKPADQVSEKTRLTVTTMWFARPADRNCEVRAKALAALLSGPQGSSYDPGSLASTSIRDTWNTVTKKLEEGHATLIKGPSDHVCGDQSCFRKTEIGYHVLIFLAVGSDSTGQPFYLGLDPDVSATKESREKWCEVAPTVELGMFGDTAESTRIIKAMVLGESSTGFGPLVRKYYVDTGKPFPPIKRV